MVETIALFHQKYVELDEISVSTYIPIAYNRTSFREKFGMLRQKKKNENVDQYS